MNTDTKMLTIRSSIVGTYYRTPAEKSELYTSKAGAEIKLIREPRNQFDSNAIKVMLNDYHVGYLSKSDASEYAPVMDYEGVTELTGHLVNTTEKYPIIEFQVHKSWIEDDDTPE